MMVVDDHGHDGDGHEYGYSRDNRADHGEVMATKMVVLVTRMMDML